MRSEVQVLLDPPDPSFGALAQLGERLICIQEVIGSIPIGSTKCFVVFFVCFGLSVKCKYLHFTVQLGALTLFRERNISIAGVTEYGGTLGF